MRIVLCVLLTLASVAFADDPRAKLSPQEVAALRAFGNRQGREGALLNPPHGSVAREIRQTEAYLRDLIIELGGERLKNNKYKYFISINSSPHPNAFVMLHMPTNLEGRRWIYQEFSGNSPEFAQMLGFDPKESFFEISFSVGLLRKFRKNRARFASVVAHELTHFLEGHAAEGLIHEGNGNGGWWSTQAREVVADQGALELMTGKYRLEAALEALWEMAKEAPQMDGLPSLAVSHHHPGVRLAAVQARIEYIRRTNLEAARVTRDEPLPDFTQISVSANVRRSPEFDALKPALNSFLDRILPENFWISNGYSFEKDPEKEPSQALHEIATRVGANAEQRRLFTVEYLERLENLNVGKEQHLHMIFRFLIWQVVHFDGAPWKNLSHSDMDRLTYLIGKYSAGLPQDSLVQLINRAMAEHDDVEGIPKFKSRLLQSFFYNEEFQPRLAHLIRKFPVWKTFARDYILAKIRDYSGATIFKLILHSKSYSFYGSPVKTDPVFHRVMVDVMKTISTLPDDVLDLCPELIRSLRLLKENGDVEGYRHLKMLLDQQTQVYRERRLKDLRWLQKSYEDPSEDPRWKALTSMAEIPLQAEELRLVRPYVLELAQGKISEKFLLQRDSLNAPGFYNLVSEMLFEPISEEDKFNLLRLTTLILNKSLSGANLKEIIPADAAQRFAAYMKGLKPEKLLSLFAPHFPNWQNEIVSYLKKQAGFTGTYEQIFREEKWEYRFLFEVRTKMSAMLRSEESLLVLLSYPGLISQEFLDQFSAEMHFKIMNSLALLDYRTRTFSVVEQAGLSSLESTEFLLKLFLKHQSAYTSLTLWLKNLERIKNSNALALEQDDSYKKRLSQRFEELLKLTPVSEHGSFLNNELIHRLLSVDSIAKWITQYIEYRVTGATEAPEVVFNKLLEELNIRDKNAHIYRRVVALWSEKKNIQPKQFNLYYPPDTRSMTAKALPYSTAIRGLSAIVAEVRKGSMEEQIQAIEYLMGLSRDLPNYLKVVKVKVDQIEHITISLALLMLEARERLAKEDVLERTMAVNCILSGPRALGGANRGKLTLLDYFTKNVQDKNKELARLFGKAIIRSQGPRASLGFAYVFASKSLAEDTPGVSEEARILRALFTAFGVPGIKLGQYLGFTSEFEAYSEALRSLQDSATPITYYAVIQLILRRFGEDWPETHQVLRILGSGSLNITVEILNTVTGEMEAVSILREDIEASLEEDFLNLNNALKFVVADRKWGSRLRFLTGLSEINRDSIRLELDKERVFLEQKAVYSRYNAIVNGWNVKTVAAYEHGHGAMRMEKAKGSTARKVLEKNPALYKSALRALNKVEMDLMLGRTQAGYFLPTHANPDFHDGQVLIDEATRTVTILDFGQSVEITNAERELGMDLLAIVSNAQSVASATRFVNGYLAMHKAGSRFSEEEMKSILASHDRMDIFTKLIAEMKLKGAAPPLPTIHWIVAVNRSIELGKKIGINNEAVFATLIASRKFGLGPATFNRGRAVWESCASALRKATSSPRWER